MSLWSRFSAVFGALMLRVRRVLVERHRPVMVLAVGAGVCWACVVGMLLWGGLEQVQGALAVARVLFCVFVLAAGVLTFVPAQRQLRLSGLAFEGVAGTFLLFYTLAFVPPPTGWLLALPDMPVYVILALATFWSCAALMFPVTYMVGAYLFRQRARQYDVRRARRQAHEVGVLGALCVGLASLRVLTFIGVVLLLFIMVVIELLCLSFVEADV